MDDRIHRPRAAAALAEGPNDQRPRSSTIATRAAIGTGDVPAYRWASSVDDTRLRRRPARTGWKRTGSEDTPPALVPAVPGEVIRREWRPGGGGRIEPTNAKLKRAFVAATEELTDIRAPQGKAGFTNVELDGVRIDTQSYANGGTCYNVQCQAGNRSMAGVIFPIGLDLAEVKRGLLLAIAANAMFTWVPDEAEGGSKTDGGKQDGNRRNNRKPPKGGGGGKRGNNFAAASSSAIATQ